MFTITDFQSQARLFGALPILLALGAWYLARGDRLKRAFRDHAAFPGRPAVKSSAAIINLDQERATRRRF